METKHVSNTTHANKWTAAISGVLGALVMLAALALPVLALAGPAGKVEICHIPPDNPSRPQTIRISAPDVDEHLVHGDLPGACPPTAAELDPPTVRVNDDLDPTAPEIAGVNGGPPRPLARLYTGAGDGISFDFVANEIYLVSDDPADLDDFLSRWPAQLLHMVELPGADPAAAPTRIYQVAVDASGANTRRLDGDLAWISPQLHGEYQVSSEAALKLLALVASETRQQGLHVGINPMLESSDFSGLVSEEAMIGDNQASGPLSFEYTSNAFEWPYMDRNPDVPGDAQWPLDTGVAEAIRSVEAEGRIGNRVRAMILDGGFFPNYDFPPYVHIGALRVPNPDPSGCGRGHPAPPDSVCGTHGTHVAITGFGLPDNGFGTMGPGGPVSELITVQSPSTDLLTIIGYIVSSLPAALAERPKIINVSASTAIPGGWCPLACPPMDLLGNWLFDRGIVFVAAAGNSNEDVDKTDEICILGCIEFEAAQVIPCEIARVICVGAHTFFESRRTSYSNYGSATGPDTVDIFAPGNLYSVDAVQADTTTARRDDLQLISGTSFSSPFVAGVFALTSASNPALSSSQLHNCVLGSAHGNSLTGEARRINALGAVSCAMAGTWPWVEINQPAEGDGIERGTDHLSLIASTDDYEQGNSLGIGWTSSRDGFLGSSSHGVPLTINRALGMSIGAHEICASVNDNSGRDWDDCVNINITSAAPVVDILSPYGGQRFIQSATVPLLARVTDLDGSPLSVITWEAENSDAYGLFPIATGSLDTSFPASDLPIGRYWLRLRVEDDTGAAGLDSVGIEIIADPSDLPPTITVVSPTNGVSIPSPDGGPVVIELNASASDPEDGPIDFEEIEWRVRDTQGYLVPLALDRECLLYWLDNPGVCQIYGPWTFQLAPRGSETITHHVISGTVTDSSGNETTVRLNIYITQLI